ncbi:expressed unknown protein [Seminavis robusta]|uniref:Uncharacterized protein n=1 Tax=Seminavis robusta TaxID=568900 RepID=A0A9N8EIZ9_9STRA|nr:expressed unknown protein [Seminavis robusta]|eukprot:Sro1074_g238320.1 n/a (196) ;mRNA; r:23019-23674
MVACAGATVENLYDQIDYLNAKYPRERATHWRGSTFLLTLGINGASFNCVQHWLTTLNPLQDCSTNSDNLLGNLDQVQEELTAALTYLVSEANEATIRVLADFFDNEYVGKLNAISQEVVQSIQENPPPFPRDEVDMEFIDVNDYLTMGSCSNAKDYLDLWGFQLGLPTVLSVGAYHPTPRGYDKYYEAVLDNLG